MRPVHLPNSLQNHRVLASALGPNDEVVPAALLAAEDRVNDALLRARDVLRSGLGRQVDLERGVLDSVSQHPPTHILSLPASHPLPQIHSHIHPGTLAPYDAAHAPYTTGGTQYRRQTPPRGQ